MPERKVRPLLHPGFIAMGAGMLIGGFVTDWMYYQSALWQWSNFSAWFILGGLVFALIAVIVLIIEIVTGRAGRISWVDFIILAVAAILSIFNAFIHSRDAWTSVVPEGIILSAIVTILLIVAAFRGWSVTDLRYPGERP